MMKDFNLQTQYIKPCGCKGAGKHQLYSFDAFSDIPTIEPHRFVEVQFKNTRKELFYNPLDLALEKEDMVAVEGSPGLDIGRVSLVGVAVEVQQRCGFVGTKGEPKQIYRLATEHDLARYREAKALEHRTMIESRQIAADLGLEMKIGDVEYQGDGTKAIFYYIAEGRVDFRQLIRVLASTFRIRVEMKQIGARQETGRIGGIGPCGRQLCCSSWMKRFHSVNTQAARFQELPLNPDKLTGQCGKLKCCTNFEVDTYVEAQKRIPDRGTKLLTQEGNYTFVKADVLKNELTYRKDSEELPTPLVTIPTWRAKQIIKENNENITPSTLIGDKIKRPTKESKDILDTNSLTRFDNEKRRDNRNKTKLRNASMQKTSSVTKTEGKEPRKKGKRKKGIEGKKE